MSVAIETRGSACVTLTAARCCVHACVELTRPVHTLQYQLLQVNSI